VDAFTKWAEAQPIAEVLVEQVFCRFGSPVSLLSDQGKEVDGMPIVLAGDVNVRLDRPTDSAAKRFTDLLDSLEMTQHVTRAIHTHDGILDVVVTRSDDSPSSLSVTEVGLSDHYLVTWSLNVRRTSVPLTSRRNVACGKISILAHCATL